MTDIDTTRRDLIEEFRRNPIGRHSPDLRLLLNRLRTGQGDAPYILVCIVPHREWRLARKAPRRMSPVMLLPGPVFTTPEAAEWAVFTLLWQERTGEALS